MESSISSPDDPTPAQAIESKGRFRFLQVGISTFLLGIACTAVWFHHLLNLERAKTFKEKLEASQPLSRELFVNDASKVAIVQGISFEMDRREWKVYLPNDEWELRVATRGVVSSIPHQDKVPEATASSKLGGGTHRIELNQRQTDDGWEVKVRIDGNDAIVVRETKDWNPAGSSSESNYFEMLQEFDSNAPITLMNRQYYDQTTGSGTSIRVEGDTGLLLWLHPTK
jgi:hypothetical protein